MICTVEILCQVYELQGTRYDPPPYLPARVKGKEDKMVDTSEGMSGGGVKEEEKAPKGRAVAVVRSFFLAFQAERRSVTEPKYSSSRRAGNEPGSLDKERPKWHNFFDKMRETVDRRVQDEMLARSPSQLTLQAFRTVAAPAKDSDGRGRTHS